MRSRAPPSSALVVIPGDIGRFDVWVSIVLFADSNLLMHDKYCNENFFLSWKLVGWKWSDHDDHECIHCWTFYLQCCPPRKSWMRLVVVGKTKTDWRLKGLRVLTMVINHVFKSRDPILQVKGMVQPWSWGGASIGFHSILDIFRIPASPKVAMHGTYMTWCWWSLDVWHTFLQTHRRKRSCGWNVNKFSVQFQQDSFMSFSLWQLVALIIFVGHCDPPGFYGLFFGFQAIFGKGEWISGFPQPRWPKILGALQHAYDACSFKGRAEMQLRLRSRFFVGFSGGGGNVHPAIFSRV